MISHAFLETSARRPNLLSSAILAADAQVTRRVRVGHDPCRNPRQHHPVHTPRRVARPSSRVRSSDRTRGRSSILADGPSPLRVKLSENLLVAPVAPGCLTGSWWHKFCALYLGHPDEHVNIFPPGLDRRMFRNTRKRVIDCSCTRIDRVRLGYARNSTVFLLPGALVGRPPVITDRLHGHTLIFSPASWVCSSDNRFAKVRSPFTASARRPRKLGSPVDDGCPSRDKCGPLLRELSCTSWP